MTSLRKIIPVTHGGTAVHHRHTTAMVMHGLASAKNVAPGRRLISSRGGRRALLLPDSRPPAASLTRSIKYAVERVSEHQRPTSTAYSTAAAATAAATAAESSAVSRLRQVPGRTSKVCWDNGSRSLLHGGLSYCSSRAGCFLPFRNDELIRRGMWSLSAMQQQQHPVAAGAGGASRAFVLPSPPWAVHVAGLQTTASGSGGHNTGGDKRSNLQMGVSSSSSTADGTASASCTRPPPTAAAAASQEFARGPVSEEQATQDQQETDKANYAGEGGKGEDGGATPERGDELPSGGSGGGDGDAPRMAEIRDRLRDARLDARDDARDWIKDKRDDMSTMQETLRDARRDGRLREELSDQAKESRGRLRELWRKYGAVGIGVYFSIYFGSIAFFYGVYDYGVMTTLPSGGAAVIERMQEWMKDTPEWAHHYSDRLFGAMAEDHRARSFVLAWATCKVLEPLRLIASIAVTPRVARALGRAPAKGVDDDDDDDNLEGAGAGSETDKSRGGGKEEGGGDRR